MSKKFVGRLAVVTGGSTGMGLATAKRFVQEGMDHVFITGRGQGALDAATAGQSVQARVKGKAIYVKKADSKDGKGSIVSTAPAGKP
jgi:NAD(P)-dependent dehydrogenase (short-subunit alcohol dehydrogenase family)